MKFNDHFATIDENMYPVLPTKIDHPIEYVGLIIEPPKNEYNQLHASGNKDLKLKHPNTASSSSALHATPHDPQPVKQKVDASHHSSSLYYQKTEEIIADSFSEMVSENPIERNIPLVVLDSANIGWNYGKTRFSVYGLQLALAYFAQYSHRLEVKAFIPSSYVQKKSNSLMETDDLTILQTLIHKRSLTIVPSGDSDDAYIINYARQHCGFIISNDFFHDHITSLSSNSSMKLSMKLWLNDNRISYTFIDDNQFFINPNSFLSLRFEEMKEKEESSVSPRSTALKARKHALKGIQYLSNSVLEFVKIQRYNEVQQLLMMKAQLYFEVCLSFSFLLFISFLFFPRGY
jgi:hypothetical protein